MGAILAVSFIGFFDAAYLTVQHYQQGIVPCIVFEGCEEVLASKYAQVGGIPTSLIGAIYYLAIFISTLLFVDRKNPFALKVIGYLPIAGFTVSLFLVYLQIFVIKAICTYCVVSAVSSTILFVLGLKVLKFKSKINL